MAAGPGEETTASRPQSRISHRLPVDVILGHAIQLLGIIWLLSWLGLYLEIFRYHHVVLSRMMDVLLPPRRPGPGPGGFVTSVVLWSLLAPPIFSALWILSWTRRKTALASDPIPRPVLTAFVLIGLGLSIGVLGIVNQLVRKPPLLVDLTLQTGNGGFVVVGLALAIAGFAVRRRSRRVHRPSLERGSAVSS
jgi:hypothetical protein